MCTDTKFVTKSFKPSLKNVDFSVPQGYTYGLYLFIVYTNCIQYFVKRLGGEAIIYVDDTNIIVRGKSLEEVKAIILTILKELKLFFALLNLSLKLG